MSALPARVACIIPAKDEQRRIAATVTAARTIRGVALVIVCDDGSSDATAQHAAAAGAIVVSHTRNRGKAAAVESAVNALGVIERRDRGPECGALLLIDADLEETAARCAPLVEPVLSGRADLTIGVLPAQHTADGSDPGGFGLVMTTASVASPNSPAGPPRPPVRTTLPDPAGVRAGQSAGRRLGIEVGMTIDILRAGMTVEEIDIELRHRATGKDLAGQLHRAKQLRDVTRALTARGLVGAGIKDFKESGGVQGLLNRFKR